MATRRSTGCACRGLVVQGPIHKATAMLADRRRAGGARQAQRLLASCGEDTVPARHLQVFSTTYSKVHDPVFSSIDFDLDVDGRTARLVVPGVIEARGEPIVNPVSGEEHRARINIPHGFEYETAEVGRGWAETKGALAISLADSHAQFAPLHMTESGLVH